MRVLKKVLQASYAGTIQIALKPAKLLSKTDLGVLQVLVIYLVASRNNIDSEPRSLLTGFAKRLTISMGLHKEGDLQDLVFICS
ncbi:uncharacterized protein JN550_002107 [Neoarthrinium moseri]|uniref:uncharacterized protein n=1 Tax=Neoarthrinium moseri TaxID=1658444 RepID=UPI001FDBDBE0|nr:uncharacterized protein JN550_002107 [Neoarthrinium moseri]KAI1875821.1 hypothetical protein JN550_002107 [Neoarthrinium moseri]